MKKVMIKIKESLTHNVGIKIIAVIVATLVWLTVINITDPEKTIVIYNVPVNVTHEEALSNMNMVYEVKNDKYVNITISGKRSVVSKLSSDDFKATASLKELSKVNSVPIEVTAKQGSIARKVTIEKQSMQTLMVDVEQIKKQNFNIQVEYSGNAADGYVAKEYTLSKNSVSIKAPTSILNRISKVVAECELEGASRSFSKRCKLAIYDTSGNVITSDHITMSSKKVDVLVDIEQEKEVPVKIGNIGTPPEGYEIKSTSLSMDKVKLVGDSYLLSQINKIDITDKIDISSSKGTYKKQIDLNKYVPEGVAINGDSVVTVQIEISQLATKTFTIKKSDIAIENQGEQEVEIMGNVKITLQGESDKIAKISTGDIQASVNVDKLSAGKHSVTLDVTLPDGIIAVDEKKIDIKIK